MKLPQLHDKDWNKLAIVLAIVVYLAAVGFMLNYHEVAWDEARYLEVADWWYQGAPAFAGNLYLSPLLPFIELLIFLAVGVNLAAVKIVYAIFPALLVYGAYRLAALLETRRVAFAAAVLTAFTGTVAFWSTRLYTDAPGAALLVLTAYFFVLALRERKTWQFAAAGLLLGLTGVARIPNLTIAAAAGTAYLLANYKLDRKLFLQLAGLGLALVPLGVWMVYLWVAVGNPLAGLEDYGSLVGQRIDLARNVTALATAADPIWWLLVAAGLFCMRSWRDMRVLALVAAVAVYVVLPYADVRYAIPALVFGAAVGGAALRLKWQKAVTLAIVAVVLINGVALYATEAGFAACAANSATARSGAYIAEHTPADAVVFAENWWTVIEWYSKRDTYAALGDASWLDELAASGRLAAIVTISANSSLPYLSGFELKEEFDDGCRHFFVWLRR